MSVVSSACLTRVMEHLDLNVAESLRDVTRLRLVGFCGSARCGKSRIARSLGGSSWRDETSNINRSALLLSGSIRTTSTSVDNPPASPLFSASPLSASDAHAMSPLIPISTLAAIHGVSTASASLLVGGAIRGDLSGDMDVSSSYYTSANNHSSSLAVESQVILLDCRIPWGADGLEKSVASFMPVFATPASVVVWMNKPTSSSFEDTIMGLYSCCSVARQLCAARGSGSPSIYEKPPSLHFVNRDGSQKTNSAGTSKSLTSTALFKAALLSGGDEQLPDEERAYHKLHLQRNYPHLLPLLGVIQEFFARSISVFELADTGLAQAEQGSSTIAMKKEEREVLQSVLTGMVATAWVTPTVDDIRRQLSVLRSSSASSGGTGGHSAIRFGARGEPEDKWSWLSVLETVFSNPDGEEGSDSFGDGPLGALETKREDFLLEEALDTLHSALSDQIHSEDGGEGGSGVDGSQIKSLEDGVELAGQIADCYFSPSSTSPSTVQRYERVATDVVRAHLESQKNRIQAAKFAQVEKNLLGILTAFTDELDSVEKLVALSQREDKDIPLW